MFISAILKVLNMVLFKAAKMILHIFIGYLMYESG